MRSKSGKTAEQQWAKWIAGPMKAIAKAKVEGIAPSGQAQQMLTDFEAAWDLLVDGDVGGAAELTKRWKRDAMSLKFFYRTMLQRAIQTGYEPPTGGELVGGLVRAYVEGYEQAHSAQTAQSNKTQRIGELLGVAPAVDNFLPKSDSNYKVRIYSQPIERNILDPNISEGELAELLHWAKSGTKEGMGLWYIPRTQKLYLVRQDIRTARRTGWDE